MATKPIVVIGFVGTVLDAADGPGRWDKWRPTVALGMYDDLLVSRLELLLDERRFTRLASRLTSDLAEVSPETKVQVHDFHLAAPWDFEQVFAALHEFARNYPFDPEREDYLVHISTGTHVAQICWFLLTEARFFPARLLQTSPPHKQRAGRAGSFALIDLDLARYDRIAQRFARERADTATFLKSGIETRSPTFNRMIEQIERVAIRSKAPMLLLGPTGAGKSMLARNLFDLKQQRHALKGRFVEVNCATLRGDGAGSALFGHVRGAFTGAQAERAGFLKSADGGLLFLDEIGELGLDEQAMLLRAIEDKRFPPLGGDKEVHSAFQLLAGTNRALAAADSQGRFREDLYARLHGERVTFKREARERYLRFAVSAEATWPGNFRDLGASVTRMATLSSQGRITVELVDEETRRHTRMWGTAGQREGSAELRAVLGDLADDIDLFD